MRKFELRMKEKYDVIKELVDHNGNKNQTSKNSIYLEDKLIVLLLFIMRKQIWFFYSFNMQQ